MRNRSRLLVAALPVALTASWFTATAVTAAPGDKVDNPGPVTMTVNAGGFFKLGTAPQIPLASTTTATQCNDGSNNDTAVDDATKQQDLNIDFDGGVSHGVVPATAVDAQCNSGGAGKPAQDDDSEVKGGFQPRQYVTLTGSVAADGTIAVPQANISFPPFYVFSSQANGIIDVIPTATGAASGTLDPATGKANMHVDWKLRVSQAFLKINCASAISMDLSSDAADPANSGSIPVSPVAYNTTDGSVTVTGNTFAVGAMQPEGVQTFNDGSMTSGSAVLTTSSPHFASTDVGRSVTVFGAGAGGANITANIKTFTSSTSVTLATPAGTAGTTVAGATWTLADSSQALCDTVAGGFGLPAASGSNAAQLSVTSTTAFVPPAATPGIVGTVTAASGGAPLQGITVTLMDDAPSWTIAATTFTDANGYYHFDNPPAGNYRIRFFDGTNTYMRQWYSTKGSYSTGDTVVYASGVVTADQALQNAPAGKLKGRAFNGGGAGVAGVNVRVFDAAGGGYLYGATTGASGYYIINGVPDGNYLIQFVDPSHTYRQQWYNFKYLAFNADTVVVAGGDTWASALMGA